MSAPGTEWVTWNPKNLPEPGVTILAIVRSFSTKKERYALLIRVKEDDVSFRTYDDHSEFAEMAWGITQWKELNEIN